MSDTHVSRRELLGRFTRDTVKKAVRETEAKLRDYMRPPGAVDEVDFLELCAGASGCRDCGLACPHAAIFVLDTEDYSDGTPVMAPDERACQLCEEQPCVNACETGALSEAYFAHASWGVAVIDESSCFAFKGPECGACAGLCPGDVDALQMVLNRPRLSQDDCVGCGICIDACPMRPAAIRFERRRAP